MPYRASRGQAMIIRMPWNRKTGNFGNTPTDPPAVTGLTVIKLMSGLLVGPSSCCVRASIIDKPLLRP